MERGQFTGLCPLCGAATTGSYCYAHTWAAGEPAPVAVPVPRPLELVAGPSTGSGRRLIRKTA